jgi:hypothetical protein
MSVTLIELIYEVFYHDGVEHIRIDIEPDGVYVEIDGSKGACGGGSIIECLYDALEEAFSGVLDSETADE